MQFGLSGRLSIKLLFTVLPVSIYTILLFEIIESIFVPAKYTIHFVSLAVGFVNKDITIPQKKIFTFA